jgi:hypothetical protein
MTTDLTPLTTDTAAPLFVAIARDADGRALIGLDAAALDALDDLLDALPLAHDMVGDYPPAAVDVVSLLRDAVSRLLRPGLS